MGEFWHVRELQLVSENNRKHGDFSASDAASELEAPILSGLAVTTMEYLVVGTQQTSSHNAGLLIFDLHAGGAPVWFRWPAGLNFSPVDISCTPDGGLLILDRDLEDFSSEAATARVWHLDKNFRVLDCNGESIDLNANHDFFNQESEVEESEKLDRFLSGIALSLYSPGQITSPVSVEAIADNAFVILDVREGEDYSTIHYYRDSELVDSIDLNEDSIGNLLNNSEITAHDIAFLPGADTNERIHRGLLYVSASNIAQSFEFALQASDSELELAMQPKLLPMRAQTGKALIVSGLCPYYDFEDRWLPLAEQPRHQYQSRAELEGLVFDGEEPDCVWHRIVIDACIPPGTRVHFESRSSNSLADLVSLPWREEPNLYLRAEGSELPLPEESCFNNSEHAGSFELLFQNAIGRYLELRLSLIGTRRATPIIRACRVYYPRFSYLKRYLPSAYQDDYKSASFLDRFLANIEGMYTQIENKIAHADYLFDTRTTPPEFLEWLGQWLGAFVDPVWDLKRKRLFVENAALLFNWRGTPTGLRALIKLCIDECPEESIFEPLRFPSANTDSILGGRDIRIVERFLTRRLVQTDTSETQTDLALTSSSQSWQPVLGAGALHLYYQNYLLSKYKGDIAALNSAWELQSGTDFSDFTTIKIPPLTPLQSAQARDWEEFTRDNIGFTYPPVSLEALPLYQEFLNLRYKRIDKLNSAHGYIGKFALKDFDEIVLPTQLPLNQKALVDWIEFVSLSLPISQQAHQFTVYLPTKLGELPAAMERRRAQVEEIVLREKPAHTQFDVQFFWAMFQVGSVRLGIDTSIGEGSRFVAMVLGANFLGQSFLSESHPWSVFKRTVVGRERLTYDLKWRP